MLPEINVMMIINIIFIIKFAYKLHCRNTMTCFFKFRLTKFINKLRSRIRKYKGNKFRCNYK